MPKLIARLEKVLTASALLLATTAAAQPGLDFSGRWTAAPPTTVPPGTAGGADPTALPNTMGSGWGTSLTIEQSASALVVERAQFVQYDMQPAMRLTYALDGSESRNTINIGRGPQDFVSKAVWQERTLVITTSLQFRHPITGKAETTDLKQVLSLDSSGALVVTTTLAGALGGPESTTSTRYTKGS